MEMIFNLAELKCLLNKLVIIKSPFNALLKENTFFFDMIIILLECINFYNKRHTTSGIVIKN